MACFSCGRQLHSECRSKSESGCCCKSAKPSVFGPNGSTEEPERAERRLKENVTISAGRKRAAVLYKVDPTEPCEWRQLANVGGGLFPIVGCPAGFQEHRHHGPDKTTTNNDRKNIHLICSTCHNRWHAKNNGPYRDLGKLAADVFAKHPHDPRIATPKEIVTGELDDLYIPSTGDSTIQI